MRKIDEVIRDHRVIGITAHIRPDGDAIGSCLGLWNYLTKKYPDRDIRVYLDPLPDKFLFLPGASQVRQVGEERKFDLFITLDCGAIDRIGPAARYFYAAKETVCVDHHVRMGDFARINYIFPDASSTSELIFDLIDQEMLDDKIAQCLYMGIAHDTGLFQYSCTSEKTMRIAGRLMSTGIDYSGIIDATFSARSFAQNRVLGHALDKARLYANGSFVASYITKEEMDSYGVAASDLDHIVSQLRVTKGVEVACFLYQVGEDDFKVSFRSNGRIDVAALAMEYGGGGHVRAAGCNTALEPKEAIRLFADRVEDLLS